MFTAIRPGDDFYRYANGRWLDTTPIPDGIPRVNTYSDMQVDLAHALRYVLEAAAADPDLTPDSTGRQLGDFFASGMDTLGIETAGMEPLQPEWSMIDAVDSPTDLARTVAHLHRGGVSVFFDIHEARRWEMQGDHQLFLRQGGLGLGRPSDYSPTPDGPADLAASYGEHLKAIFILAGAESGTAEAAARRTLTMETALAQLWESEGTDPRGHDKRVAVGKLARWMPGFDWSAYLEELGIADEERLILRQPDYFRALGDLMKSMEASAWRPYLRACLLHRAAAFMGRDLVAEHDRFHQGVLRNRHRVLSRERRVSTAVERSLPWAVGDLYCQHFFRGPVEAAGTRMVDSLKGAFERITRRSISLNEKQKNWQIEKLKAMEFRIGGPAEPANLSGLDLVPHSYLRNAFAAHRHRLEQELARLGQPWDDARWSSTPQSLDAIYDRNHNRVTISASLFQPPVFDPDGDPAANLGMLGTTIAHEMSHGFDHEGRRFDKDGETHWWVRRGAGKFDRETDKLVEIFWSYEVLDGKSVDAKGTLMENTADLGGLTIAYEALSELLQEEGRETRGDLSDARRRFFLAYAQKKREVIRDDALEASLSGPHAPSRFRVLGPLTAFEGFQETFVVDPTDGMFRNPEDLVSLW